MHANPLAIRCASVGSQLFREALDRRVAPPDRPQLVGHLIALETFATLSRFARNINASVPQDLGLDYLHLKICSKRASCKTAPAREIIRSEG
jgi:hypothetical protein